MMFFSSLSPCLFTNSIVQFLGSKEIGNYRGSTVVMDTLAEVRKAVKKKQKVQVTIKFKGMVILDEKSKVCNLIR